MMKKSSYGRLVALLGIILLFGSLFIAPAPNEVLSTPRVLATSVSLLLVIGGSIAYQYFSRKERKSK